MYVSLHRFLRVGLRVGLRVESVKKADESQCDYGEEAAKSEPSDKRGEGFECAFHLLALTVKISLWPVVSFGPLR